MPPTISADRSSVRRTSVRRTSVRRSGAERLRDRLLADDPGGFAGRAALRAFLTFVLSGGLMLVAGVPLSGALIGSSMGMTVIVSVSDAQPRAQAISMALGTVASIVAACIAALVSTSPWTASTVLCVVVFMSVVGRALGARATAIGLLAFMGYFFALFVVARPSQIPLFASSIAAGGATALLVRFVLLREHVGRVHASVLGAFRARVQLMLDDLVGELEAGKPSERRLRRIRRHTGRVNESALALEEAAGRSADEPPAESARPWLLQLLDAEVGVDMLAEATQRSAEREGGVERRREIADTVRALQRWIADDSPTARAEVERLEVERLLVSAEPDVAHAVTLLLAARPWSTFPLLPDSALRVSMMSFRGGGGGMAGMHGAWPNLRLGVQATIAVALAIVAGRAISEQRWYWAVLAAFFVFIRATTFAETVSRAWQRVFGTVLGVTLGTLIAELLRRHGTLEIVVALLAMLIGYALLRVSYGGMILFITIALALLYEMMGQPVPGLMELRLAETAAGSLIGVLVAAVVFPMHSGMRIRRLVADVLREVAQVIVATTVRDEVRAEARDGLGDDATLHDRIRSVDRALAEVRNAVRPLWAPQVPWESPRLSRLTRTAAALAYVTRRVRTEHLCALSSGTSALAQVGAALARNCDAVADALVTPRAPALEPVAPMLDELRREASDDAHATGATVRLYRDVDALVQRLAAEASHTPARDGRAPFDDMRDHLRAARSSTR